MELRSLLRLLRSRLLPVLVTVVAGAAVGFGLSPRQAQYESTATIYVGARSFEFGDASLSGDQNLALGLVAQTFAELIESEQLAGDALELTGIATTARALVGATSATVEPGTTLIRITVVDADPAVSRALTNGLADAFIDQVLTLEPGAADDEGELPTVPARIFERAPLPVEPLPTGTSRNVVLGALLGLLVAVGLVLLADHLDLTARSPDEVEDRLGLPVLGVIPTSRPPPPAPVAGPDG